jgi:hypothetical protein
MGNPFAHIELNTTDLGAAKKFYKKVFDWKLQDMPAGEGPPYTMIGVGKGVGGGMQVKAMPEAPTQWIAYVEVADVKKTLAKAEKNGAKVVLPKMDIGEMGSIGIFIDPAGASLGVWATKPKKAAKKPAKKAKKK